MIPVGRSLQRTPVQRVPEEEDVAGAERIDIVRARAGGRQVPGKQHSRAPLRSLHGNVERRNDTESFVAKGAKRSLLQSELSFSDERRAKEFFDQVGHKTARTQALDAPSQGSSWKQAQSSHPQSQLPFGNNQRAANSIQKSSNVGVKGYLPAQDARREEGTRIRDQHSNPQTIPSEDRKRKVTSRAAPALGEASAELSVEASTPQGKVDFPTKQTRNVVPSGNQLSRTPPEIVRISQSASALPKPMPKNANDHQVDTTKADAEVNSGTVNKAQNQNLVPSGKQLARTPIEEPTRVTGMKQRQLEQREVTSRHRNVAPSGNQLSRTPPATVHQETRNGPNLSRVINENTAMNAEVPSVSLMTQTPFGIASETNATLSTVAEQDRDLPRKNLSSGAQLARTPQLSIASTRSETTVDAPPPTVNAATADGSAVKPQDTPNDRPNPRNVVPTGSQLSRTPPTVVQQEARREESLVVAQGESDTRQNVVPSGNQLARTPIGFASGALNVPSSSTAVLVPNVEQVSLNDNKLGKSLDPGVEHGATVRKSSSASEQPSNSSSTASKPRNIVPSGSQLARTPPNSTFQDVQMEASGTSAGPDESKSRVEHVQTLGGTALRDEVFLNHQNAVSGGTQLAGTPQSDDTSRPRNTDVNADAAAANMNKDNGSQQMALRENISPNTNISDEDPKRRNIVPTGSHLSRTPPSSGNQEEKTEEQLFPKEERNPTVERRNKVPTGTQLARTPVGESLETETHNLGEAPRAPEQLKNVVPTGSQLVRTPQLDDASFTSNEDINAAGTLMTQKDDHLLLDKKQSTEMMHSAMGGKYSPDVGFSEKDPRRKNIVPTGSHLSRTPPSSGDQEEKTEEQLHPKEERNTTVERRNKVPTGTQLARTPVGETPATEQLYPDETPTVLELSKGVVPTGSLLARTPQSDNPMFRESSTASLLIADGTSMESSGATQMRNVVPTGKQLDRTPVNESSETENQWSEHTESFSNAPVEPSAHPLQVVPTVYNISRTPLREEPMLSQPNELEVTTLRNAVPTGGQLARTPIGEEPNDAVAKQGMQVTKAPGGQYLLNGKPVDENTPPASLKVSSKHENTLANSNSRPTRGRAASKEADLAAESTCRDSFSVDQEEAQRKNSVSPGQNRDRGGGDINAPEVSQRDHRGRRELRRLEKDRRKPTTREIHEHIFYGSSSKKSIAKRNENPKSRNDNSYNSAKQDLREDSFSSTEEDDEGWNNYEYDDTNNKIRDSLDNRGAGEFVLQDTRRAQVSTRDDYAQNNDSPASHGESDESKRARKLLGILFQLKKLREGGQRTSHRSCTEAIEWMLQQSFLKPTESLTPKLLEKCIGRINSELSSMQLDYHRKKEALDAIQAYNSQVLAQQNISTAKGMTPGNQAAVQGLVRQWHANQAILSQIDQRIQECGAELASTQDPHLEPELQSMRIQHGCLQKELQNLHQLQRVQSNTMAVKRLLRRVELFLVRYESLRRATKGIDQYLQTYW